VKKRPGSAKSRIEPAALNPLVDAIPRIEETETEIETRAGIEEAVYTPKRRYLSPEVYTEAMGVSFSRKRRNRRGLWVEVGVAAGEEETVMRGEVVAAVAGREEIERRGKSRVFGTGIMRRRGTMRGMGIEIRGRLARGRWMDGWGED
jgi:hypothetical protein